MNSEWFDNFPNSYGVFESGGCSDHIRGRINVEALLSKCHKPFKFVNALSSLPQFHEEVEKHWMTTAPIYESSSTTYLFTKKLKLLKPVMRKLGKDQLGNISRKPKEAHRVLYYYQSATISDPNLQNIHVEAEGLERWNKLAGLEEAFLKQSSEVHWLGVGDGNNKNFLKVVQLRQSRNVIHEVKNHWGVTLSNPPDIKNETVRYFEGLLNVKAYWF